MDGIALVFLLSVVLEKLVQLFKDIVNVIPYLPDKFKPITLQIISLTCGIVLAFGTSLNAFELMGVQASNALIGIIVTGLVIGKGSNFAHDFFDLFDKKRMLSKASK